MTNKNRFQIDFLDYGFILSENKERKAFTDDMELTHYLSTKFREALQPIQNKQDGSMIIEFNVEVDPDRNIK